MVNPMCKVIEEMCNDNSVRIYVEACRDFGVVDPAEIVKKLLAKFAFLTEEKAKEYAS